MTLLFDENLSFRLIGAISRRFPNACHVREVGLDRAQDRAIWEFAKQHGLAIVTFDSDFHELSLLEGWPPKVVWLRTGNTTTTRVRALLSTHEGVFEAFLSDREHACLVIAD